MVLPQNNFRQQKTPREAGLMAESVFKGSLGPGFPYDRPGYILDLLTVARLRPFPNGPDRIALGGINREELAGIPVIGFCKGF